MIQIDFQVTWSYSFMFKSHFPTIRYTLCSIVTILGSKVVREVHKLWIMAILVYTCHLLIFKLG